MDILIKEKYLKTKDPNWVRPSKRKNYVKNYNQKYNQKMLAQRQIKITCACGKELASHSLRAHIKSKYHLKKILISKND